MTSYRTIKIPPKLLKEYLESVERKRIRIKKYEKLGKGWHGVGYKIVYFSGKKEKTVILRTEIPFHFSHDYLSDRAKVFILQHNLSKVVQNHIKSFDVIGLQKDKLVSVGKCKEFYQIVEEAKGSAYLNDIERIKKENTLTKKDKQKALILSNYLVKLHKKRFIGSKKVAESVYKRHTRDCIGHGEMLIGVLDTYPEKLSWITKDEIIEIVKMTIDSREKIKKNYSRLHRIHGDFHPGNILFSKNKLQLLDASREEYGEPADDLTCLAINYIWYAIMQNRAFKGPFKELFEIYWNNYIKKTKDYNINKIAPLFFAFRGVVVSHPFFYKKQTNETRRKVFNFIKNVLKEKRFDPRKINDYIK